MYHPKAKGKASGSLAPLAIPPNLASAVTGGGTPTLTIASPVFGLATAASGISSDLVGKLNTQMIQVTGLGIITVPHTYDVRKMYAPYRS